jgi:ABC-type dipeptide/oligopeptide/nickel transport system permease component
MRMWTYILRRILLVVPVLIGVVTITFILFQALPIEDRLISHFGSSPHQDTCYYTPSCECLLLNPHSVNPAKNTCDCIDPTVVVTPSTQCPSPWYNERIKTLGLNTPVPEQWALYIERSFTFQWGTVANHSALGGADAAIRDKPVATALSWELPYTLELAAVSLTLIMIIAIPLGNYTAVNRNRPVDQASRLMSFSGFALPAFLLGNLLLIAVTLLILPHTGFQVHSPWCPAGETLPSELQGSIPTTTACYGTLPFGQQYPAWIANGLTSKPTGFVTIDAALHGQYWLSLDTVIRIILPALVIAYGTVAVLLRFVRNSMLEVMNLDYVRTARAKGVPEKIVTKKHAGRNSLNVTITVLGLTFAGFVSGFPVIEDVFGLNGVGATLATAVVQPIDYAMIFGSTLLFTFLVVAANIIVDVLYAYLDPRVRLG